MAALNDARFASMLAMNVCVFYLLVLVIGDSISLALTQLICANASASANSMRVLPVSGVDLNDEKSAQAKAHEKTDIVFVTNGLIFVLAGAAEL